MSTKVAMGIPSLGKLDTLLFYNKLSQLTLCRFLINGNGIVADPIPITMKNSVGGITLKTNNSDISLNSLPPDVYQVTVAEAKEIEMELKLGGVYTFVASARSQQLFVSFLSVFDRNPL